VQIHTDAVEEEKDFARQLGLKSVARELILFWRFEPARVDRN